jgi:hypothetical protein
LAFIFLSERAATVERVNLPLPPFSLRKRRAAAEVHRAPIGACRSGVGCQSRKSRLALSDAILKIAIVVP